MQAQVLYWLNFKNTRDSVLIVSPYIFYNIYRLTRSSNGKQNAQINLINTKPNCSNARSLSGKGRSAPTPTTLLAHNPSTGSHGCCEGKAKKNATPPKKTQNTPKMPNPTANRHPPNQARSTALETCPLLVPWHWGRSCADTAAEWLEGASSVQDTRVLFNPAFTPCPLGVLRLERGPGRLQLSWAQGVALPCLDATWYPHHWQQQSKNLTPWKSMDKLPRSCCCYIASNVLNA